LLTGPLTGLKLVEDIGYKGFVFLVVLLVRGHFEGAVKRDRSAGSHGGK